MEFIRENYHINNNMTNLKLYLTKVLELLKRYRKMTESDFEEDLSKKIELISKFVA